MSARAFILLACGLLGTGSVAGCTSGPTAPHHLASHYVASSATPPAPQAVTRADARRCPKTIPRLSSASGNYGNGKLSVTLDTNGVIVAGRDFLNPDGSIHWKFPWWRMVAGELTITGRRLDAQAPPLASRVPSGYGDIGFQASGVIFPSEGCWQVTGRIAHTSLTFITFVITKAHRSLLSSNG